MSQRPALPAPKLRPAHAPHALEAVKVLDFSHFVAGPQCTQILGDLGAEIIKIERPGAGDHYRAGGPKLGNDAACFIGVNRNKQSVALDLSHPEGLAVARELAAQADILVENFSPGVMERLGLGWQALSALNPRLIYCSISGWGGEGEFAQRPSFDPIAQAESGFLSLTGDPGGATGMVSGAPVMDMTTGMMASSMVLAALYARERLGQGQQLHIALLDQAVNMLGFRAMNYLATGVVPPRTGNRSRQTVPVGVYDTADRPIYLCCANERTWQRLLDVLGRPELAQVPEFANGVARQQHADQLNQVLSEALARQSAAHWLARMHAVGVPAAQIHGLDEALAADSVRSRDLVSRIPHPVAGEVPNIASPFRMSLTPLADPVAAPRVGEHTDAALARLLGYDEARLRELRAGGAIG